MVFSSITFLFYFLPAFLLLYYVLPWKNSVLLLASLLFYAWGEPRFVPLLMVSALLNYGFGVAIGRATLRRKLLLWLGVAANLGMLAYYKYLGFFTDILNQVLPNKLAAPTIVLPLGISFFVFQGLSYLIDVYRGQVDAQKSFWNFAMYKAMFPQLIAGPIVRYQQIAGEINQRVVTSERLWRGFRQFSTGLAQKVLIANTIALPADQLFAAGPASLDAAGAWLAVACYSVQILFGIAHMIGFSYPPNFQRPYSAISVTDFWRRWHMSLSSWFRDYVYIPLGGNRAGPWRTYANLALVFLLCGLWHGAAWTFIIWGAWHGALLVLERAGFGRVLARMPSLLGQGYTLLMVMIGWVFFRAADLPTAWKMLQLMFGGGAGGGPLHDWRIDIGPVQWSALAIGILLAVWRREQPAQPFRASGWRLGAGMAAALLALLLCGATLAAGTYNPFIYFRF